MYTNTTKQFEIRILLLTLNDIIIKFELTKSLYWKNCNLNQTKTVINQKSTQKGTSPI